METLCQNTVSAQAFYQKRLLATLFFVVLLVLSSLAAPAEAGEIESLKNLRSHASRFLDAQLAEDKSMQYSVGKLDPRLRLPVCKSHIEAFLPENHRLLGHTTIGLRCASNKGWKVHIPVHIRQFKKVLISNRNLPRGHQLLEADVTGKKMDVSLLSQGYYENITQLSGLLLTRSILRGQYLTPGMLAKPRWVRRGQTITILAKTGQVAIRVKGKALMDGRQGELVRVKNISTNKELRGIVVAEGIVKVTL